MKNDVDENASIFLTGLLHYLLTNSLIPSQRKIEYNGIELDIVIPNVKTLETKPKNSLIICIPKSFEQVLINEKLRELLKIQPNKENIWVVLKEMIQSDFKIFEIKNKSVIHIIDEINNFLDKSKQTQFKIFKSNLVSKTLAI